MSLYVGSTVINTAAVEKAVVFWTAALGHVVRDSDPTFAVLTDPGCRWSNVFLQRSDEPKAGRNRVYLDLYAADRDGGVARLEGLGATRVSWDYRVGHDHIVMGDFDGNEFCVIQSSLTQD